MDHVPGDAVLQGTGGTCQGAGRPQARIHALAAAVALGDFAVLGIELRVAEGAGHGAGLAADTKLQVRKDPAVVPLLHGTGGAGQHAGRPVAVIAGGRQMLGHQTMVGFNGPGRDRHDGARPGGQIVFELAGRHAGLAADAHGGIDHQRMAFARGWWGRCHRSIPFNCSRASSGACPLR